MSVAESSPRAPESPSDGTPVHPAVGFFQLAGAGKLLRYSVTKSVTSAPRR